MDSSDAKKKQSYDYSLIAMAYHEAGHTIVALYNYLLVHSVSVMSVKREEGDTIFYIYSDRIDDKQLSKILLHMEVQVLYAGLIAEKKYYKDICGSSKFPMHLKIGSYLDTSLASSIIRKNKLANPGKETTLLKKRMQANAEAIIIEHWDSVKLIAHSLYKKKRLNFHQLKSLLTRKSNNNIFWKEKFKNIIFIHNKKFPTEESVKAILNKNI